MSQSFNSSKVEPSGIRTPDKEIQAEPTPTIDHDELGHFVTEKDGSKTRLRQYGQGSMGNGRVWTRTQIRDYEANHGEGSLDKIPEKSTALNGIYTILEPLDHYPRDHKITSDDIAKATEDHLKQLDPSRDYALKKFTDTYKAGKPSTYKQPNGTVHKAIFFESRKQPDRSNPPAFFTNSLRPCSVCQKHSLENQDLEENREGTSPGRRICIGTTSCGNDNCYNGSVCGDETCHGQGFGQHDNWCKFCGKADCQGYMGLGKGIHPADQQPTTRKNQREKINWSNKKPRPETPRGDAEKEPESTYKSPEGFRSSQEALNDILISVGLATPDTIGSLSDKQVHKASLNRTVFNSSKTAGAGDWDDTGGYDPDNPSWSQREFSGSGEGAYDPASALDDPEHFAQQEAHHESKISGELDEDATGADVIEKEPEMDNYAKLIDEEMPDPDKPEFDSNGIPTKALEEQAITPDEESYTTCPACHGESTMNHSYHRVFTEDHCKNCKGKGLNGKGEPCKSTDENRSSHCQACKNPETCSGRKHEVWYEKDANGKTVKDEKGAPITECRLCHNDGEVLTAAADAFNKATATEEKEEAPTQAQTDTMSVKPQKRKKQKVQTPPKSVHDEGAEELFSDDDDDEFSEAPPKRTLFNKKKSETAGETVTKKPSQGDSNTALLRDLVTFGNAPTVEEQVFNSRKPAPSVEAPKKEMISDTKAKGGVTHDHCGCEDRGGRATDDEIAAIKQSSAYKEGIRDINRNVPANVRDAALDDFIEKQYKCKGDK